MSLFTTPALIETSRRAHPATGAAILTALAGPRPAVASKVLAAPTKGMNKTERRYHAHLDEHKRAGRVLWFDFDRLKLRLADATFYTPDFFVVWADGRLTCDETKGFERDDAVVKFKVAAGQFPMFDFRMVKLKGGIWMHTRGPDVPAPAKEGGRA